MKMTNRKKKASRPFILGTLLLVSGCTNTTLPMDADLAGQIAVDVSGCPAGDVQNLNVSQDGSNYLVTFNNKNGIFNIQITESGKVSQYSFISNEEASQKTEEDKIAGDDGKESEVEAQTEKQDEQKQPEKTGDQSLDNLTALLPEGSLPAHELLSRAATLISVTDYLPSDFSEFSMSGPDSLSMKMQGKDGTIYTIVINPLTGSGTYTFVKNQAAD